MQTSELPVAVIGGGPVGLAAAAHLLERGLRPIVFEAGPRAGDYPTGSWGDESRDYHVCVEVPAANLGQEMLAGGYRKKYLRAISRLVALTLD